MYTNSLFFTIIVTILLEFGLRSKFGIRSIILHVIVYNTYINSKNTNRPYIMYSVYSVVSYLSSPVVRTEHTWAIPPPHLTEGATGDAQIKLLSTGDPQKNLAWRFRGEIYVQKNDLKIFFNNGSFYCNFQIL